MWQVAHLPAPLNTFLPRAAALGVEAVLGRGRRLQAELVVAQGRQFEVAPGPGFCKMLMPSRGSKNEP